MATRVEFKAGSGAAASGEIALPDGADKAPGLVLVQEWWGVNDHIRDVVDRFAKRASWCSRPTSTTARPRRTPARRAQLMQALDGKRAMDDIAGAVAYLTSHARSNGKVGVVGFCMGGAYTFAAASAIAELGAAVSFYGIAARRPHGLREDEGAHPRPRREPRRVGDRRPRRGDRAWGQRARRLDERARVRRASTRSSTTRAPRSTRPRRRSSRSSARSRSSTSTSARTAPRARHGPR